MIYKYKDKIVDTPLAKELYGKLMKITNDDEYYTLCIIAELHNDKHIQKMIDILDLGETNTNNISLNALDIYNGRI